MSVSAVASRFIDRARDIRTIDDGRSWCVNFMRAVARDFAETLFLEISVQEGLTAARIEGLIESTGKDLAEWAHSTLNDWQISDVAFRLSLGLTAVDGYLARIGDMRALPHGGRA